LDATKFIGCSFLTDNGTALLPFPDPLYETTNLPLPVFAKIDFDKIPIPCIPTETLLAFVNARRPDTIRSNKMTRSEVEEAVALCKDDNILDRKKIPKIISRWRCSDYLEDVGHDWSDDCGDIFQSLAPISEDDVKSFYPNGNEANLERAEKLVDGGNVLVRESLRYRLCRDKLRGRSMVLFKCEVVPHYKGGPNSKVKAENLDGSDQEHYTVFLCFRYSRRKQSRRRVVAHPYSCCGCHDGREFCSHMLAFLMVILLLQRYGRECYESVSPASPILLQSLPMLLENVTRRDKSKRKAAKRRKSSYIKRRQRVAWYC
jgi:hypothetical protein